MINWNLFSLKRNITIENFIQKHDIKSISGFFAVCDRFGINPPDLAELEIFFKNSNVVGNEHHELKVEQCCDDLTNQESKEITFSKKSKKNQGVEKK